MLHMMGLIWFTKLPPPALRAGRRPRQPVDPFISAAPSDALERLPTARARMLVAPLNVPWQGPARSRRGPPSSTTTSSRLTGPSTSRARCSARRPASRRKAPRTSAATGRRPPGEGRPGLPSLPRRGSHAVPALPRRPTPARTSGTARRQASAVSQRVGPKPRRSTSSAPAMLPAPIDAAKLVV
jgi:hypothetical protein